MNKPSLPTVAGAAAPVAPGTAKRPKPLRVVRGPDGKPRVIRRGLAALAAMQAGIPKVLRIGVIRDRRIVEDRIIRVRETVTIGPSEKNSFVVEHPSLRGRFPLFELREGGPKGQQYWLNFTPEMTGRVSLSQDPGSVTNLAALRSSPKVQAVSHGHAIPLTDDSRGRIAIGDTTILFQFVVPPPLQPRPQLPASVRGGWLSRVDPALVATYVVASVIHVALMCVAMIPNWPKPTIEEIIASDRFRELYVQVMAPEEPEPEEQKTDDQSKDATGEGDADKGDQTDAAQTTQVAPTDDKTRRPDDASKRATVQIGGEKISQQRLARVAAGLRNTLEVRTLLVGGSGSGPVVSFEAFGGSAGAVVNLQSALSGVVGTSDGGGSRTGGLTALAGDLIEGPAVGTVGTADSGPAGPAVGPSREDAVKVEKKALAVGKVRMSGAQQAGGTGRMDPALFRRELQQRRRAIENCYNRALVRDPTLAGELTVLVIITQAGRVMVEVEQNTPALDVAGVTACIVAKLSAMNFEASPPQGGDMRIRLPFSFMAQP